LLLLRSLHAKNLWIKRKSAKQKTNTEKLLALTMSSMKIG
jgi:hypothetical protein